jgi:RNA polymerase sigma-70 factor (ECF subfamily)
MWFKGNKDEEEQWDLPDERDNQGQMLAQRDQARRVRAAIHKLPPEQKEAIILREYCRKDYAEISQILGCSLEKVKILIFRSRERLREELLDMIQEAN